MSHSLLPFFLFPPYTNIDIITISCLILFHPSPVHTLLFFSAFPLSLWNSILVPLTFIIIHITAHFVLTHIFYTIFHIIICSLFSIPLTSSQLLCSNYNLMLFSTDHGNSKEWNEERERERFWMKKIWRQFSVYTDCGNWKEEKNIPWIIVILFQQLFHDG